ncbi:hypothetical protein AF335_05650 [Streptomyces eurocidicus]|uniref:ATP-grasp domain-containing protein n=1 Tax=Streptomyces eurocidicus TaxID=66423 RepID=A0A2N8P159_STREU|nr:hypothetical protein AF335_05650 [Streptomyces eurocidicus]
MTGAVTRVLRDFWSGRGAVLLLDDFDHRATSLVDELRACGARVGAVIARTGPAAGAPEVERSLHCSDAGLDFTRPEFEAWLRDPSDDVRTWLDGLDPAREWLALGTPRTGIDTFCGRPVHGWRRPEWAAVEDKTTIDALWAAAGVPSPPHVVVTVDEPPAGPAGLDAVTGPDGVVVAADSTRGHVGDSSGLRWVLEPAGVPHAVREFAGRADRVRIARFADGVPCSVLGMALPDGVAVFSPIEIVTLGDPATGRLLFCGSSTHWRPGDVAERDIRGAARRAGTELVRTTGYRGIFSVDGLLTPDGFTATELNPRHASGLGLRAALPDFPVYLYNRAVQEGLPGLGGITAAALEGLVRRLVAAAPSASLTVGPTLVEAVPPAPDHRAGPACADLAARLGEPGLRAFPLAAASD